MLSTKVLQVRLRFPEVGVPLHAERKRTNVIGHLERPWPFLYKTEFAGIQNIP